jgi:L-ribulose-5-phosphate 3-epimerase
LNRIGIMQGRLTPSVDDRIQCFPHSNWQAEFALAAEAGLGCIEWIYDLYGADVNPISNSEGVDKMIMLSKQHNVQVVSLCADYFMDKPLVRANAFELKARLGTLAWLMHRCKLLGINRLVLPFIDASRINTDSELKSVIVTLKDTLQVSDVTGVEIHLETSLAPNEVAKLIAYVAHPMLKINYDSGNSAALGFHPDDEFAAYGGHVGSVHIKDRIRNGGTVPLGHGDADFSALFDCLKRVSYKGDFILQVARDAPGDEVIWAQKNRIFVREYLLDGETRTRRSGYDKIL